MKRDPVDALLLGIVIGLVVCVLGGCCKTCPPPAPPVVIQERVSACVKKAPPVMPHMEWVTGAEKGCPDTWETCQSREDAAKLFLYLTDVRAWQLEAWNACGKLPKPTPPAAAK